MKLERFVKKFYDGLEDGVIYARKCLECGAIEFPPHPACNTCGYHETEWTTVTGNGVLNSIIIPVSLNADAHVSSIGEYCYGEVILDEGPNINSTIFGVGESNVEEIRAKLPVRVHAKIVQMDGFKTLFFEVDEDELKK